MSIIAGIEYGNLIFSKRHELDQAAYSKYFKDNFDQHNDVGHRRYEPVMRRSNRYLHY